MAILSIQSRVVVGHVGNSAAVPALHRLGFEVWAIDTVTFSNHPAHGSFGGRVRSAAELRALADGVAEGGRLARCEALLSGYLGKATTGPVLCRLIASLRDANPNAIYLCDPVLGDHGRLYAEPAIVDFLRSQAAPAANILIPNAFEAGLLSGRRVDGTPDALAAAEDLRARGPEAVVITGVEQDGTVGTVAVDGDGAWQVAVPRVEAPTYGAGDLFSALLLAQRLTGRTLADSVAHAVSSVHAVLARAKGKDCHDLPLISALDQVVAPDVIFPADRLR